MTQTTPPSMFERLFGRREGRPPREQEPADLGTAFGMEQTLAPPEWQELGTAAEAAHPWLPGSGRTGAAR